MLIQEKKFKDYMSQEYEPVDESAMPYLVDIRAIKAYADSKGVAVVSLSEEEKQQFSGVHIFSSLMERVTGVLIE